MTDATGPLRLLQPQPKPRGPSSSRRLKRTPRRMATRRRSQTATAPVQPTWDRDAGLRRDWGHQETRATPAEATAATTGAIRDVGASTRARFRITSQSQSAIKGTNHGSHGRDYAS